MRVVDLWRPSDEDHEANSGSMSSGPTAFGPADDAGEHHFASQLRDKLGARRASQQAHQQDMRGVEVQALRSAKKAGAKNTLSNLSLGDDWIMYRGYRNAGGEIHQLLLGPHGLVAMTSLYLDGRVHCHGDKWHVEKFGRNGQELGHNSLDDRQGRSPSAALHHAADVLEKTLHSAGHKLRVHRAVLLNHPKAFQSESHRPTVQVFTSSWDLVNWLNKTPKVLDRGGRHQIESLIGGRHGHHQS